MRVYIASQVGRAQRVYSYVQAVYQHRMAQTSAQRVSQKIRVLLQACSRVFYDRKKVLCYPDRPQSLFVISQIFLSLGLHITTDPSEQCEIAIQWHNTIGTGNPIFPPEPILESLAQDRPDIQILNMHCRDVSKTRVSKVFEEVFGYSLAVDPRTFSGKCVMKSDWNGLHLGEVIDCPMENLRENFVYEKLIHNEVEDGLVEDMRVPIFQNRIPFVYLKYRPVQDRLVDRKHTLSKTVMANVSDVLTKEEVAKINAFCKNMRLDYGEIDVLRDRTDQRIYIVDVNNDPAGPPSPISGHPVPIAIVRLSQAFEETFLTV
ncbi:hypothetical protein [Candidatus Nitrospira salsa]